MPTLRTIVIELAVMVAIAFLLAALGPYGSYGLGSFPVRLAYWLPGTLGGYAIVRPTMILCEKAAARLGIARSAAMAAGVLVSALPLTLFILWLNGNPLGYLPDFEGWFQLYLQVALIGGAITFFFWLLDRRSDGTAEAGATAPAPLEEPAPAPKPAPFLSRLPPHLREGLIALQMEDHYVRAHTAEASTLVLLRMRDAVAELSGIDGMRVHRSWWVAREAVERVEQNGRALQLILKGGLEAPVARASVPVLKAAGWLDPAPRPCNLPPRS